MFGWKKIQICRKNMLVLCLGSNLDAYKPELQSQLIITSRSGNRTGQVGFGFKSIGLGRVNLHVVFFHIFDRFWLDWRSFNLRLDQIRSDLDRVEAYQFDFFFLNQIRSDSNLYGSNEFLGSYRVLSPLITKDSPFTMIY
jgi:hypothetical protein